MMAKRKRLDPAPLDSTAPVSKPTLAPRAPIAQVSGDSAAAGALSELTEAFRRARVEGRLVQDLPLTDIQSDHLIRDRFSIDEDALGDLISSIRTRGQQTPIEVIELESGYGLISGWRRLEALRRLHEETGSEDFATVQALLRRPAEASDAYQAMVEENEIRVGLSYYERARIALRAAAAGIYPDRQQALRSLFASASRARRSKIASFMVICESLEGALRFPAAIPERLGLQLAKAIGADPDFAQLLREHLLEEQPADAAAEAAVIKRALAPPKREGGAPAGEEICSGVFVAVSAGAGNTRITLSGPNVDAKLRESLVDWLRRHR